MSLSYYWLKIEMKNVSCLEFNLDLIQVQHLNSKKLNYQKEMSKKTHNKNTQTECVIVSGVSVEVVWKSYKRDVVLCCIIMNYNNWVQVENVSEYSIIKVRERRWLIHLIVVCGHCLWSCQFILLYSDRLYLLFWIKI